MRLKLTVATLAALALALRCGPPPTRVDPPSDGGATADGGDGGQQLPPDSGEPIPAQAGRWTWIPVEGSSCGSGSTAGIGVNLAQDSDELFLYLEGGGACWNQGTCVPSLLQYGPLCDYGTFCLADSAGGTKPTSSYVIDSDPYPRDGGGAFPAAVAMLNGVRALDRADPANPFRNASFAFVPYCTGDLHSGNTTRNYSYKYNLLDAPRSFTMHFAGASNMELYLQRLRATRPNLKRIWLTGSSAGGYGATLNFERVKRYFPNAEVHLLADCSPFVPSVHWEQWRTAWSMELPQSCADCDAGMPQVMDYLMTQHPSSRMALMAYDQDRVISWFFFAGNGFANFLNPPLGAYTAALGTLEDSYDTHANARYFNVPGQEHVLWDDYGSRRPDGGFTDSPRNRDGGANLKSFIDGWAEGGAGWSSSR